MNNNEIEIKEETKEKQELKNRDYRHYINLVITLGFLALGVFIFPNSILRLAEAVRDLGTSIAYYFCGMVTKNNPIPATVMNMPKWEFVPSRFERLKILPSTWGEFSGMWGEYFSVMFSIDTFTSYLKTVGDVLYYVSQGLMILIPLGLLLKLVIDKYLNEENNDYDVESKALQRMKRIADKTYIPAKAWVREYIEWNRENDKWYKGWLLLWALYFNAIVLVIEFLAFYLYFAVSYDMLGIYTQFYKLTIDLAPCVRFIPGIIWFCIITVALELIARKIGSDILQHREARNTAFMAERGVLNILYGPMGAGKTKTLTDMALTSEVRFRNMAFEIIIECDFCFPYMNWATFEQALKKEFEEHNVYSVDSAREWVREKAYIFYENPTRENVFGYDYERYGLEYNDNLKVWELWEVIEDYACAYLVYTVQSSLLISNYSIRVDNLYEDLGNFPMWNTDFFKRDARYIDSYSRHAHIIDFDMLRLGKRMLEENPNRYAFGFGVYITSEIDKERKNTPELMNIKASADECNQKNDLYNSRAKMSRHGCVIRNRVFVIELGDLQRPESLGADARELGEILFIESHTDMQPTLPFFAPFYIFEALFALLFGRFTSSYYQYRFARGDKILPIYALKKLVAKLKHFRDRTFNYYGSSTNTILIESGRMDGEQKKTKYFIQSKKIYSRRYSTDCLSAIFSRNAELNNVGINDLPEYETERGTDEENAKQNSHFQKEIHHYN